MCVGANKLINEEFTDDAGTPLLLVCHRDGGLRDSDYAMIQALYKELYEDPVSEQSFIPPFQEIPVGALAGSSSEDGAALITRVVFDEGASTNELQMALAQME